MTIRKEKYALDILEQVTKEWGLSIPEHNLLENILDVIRERDIRDTYNLIVYYYDKSWIDLLKLVPSDDVEYYAQKYLELIPEDECDCEDKTLEDFDDDEIEQEYFDRNNVGYNSNIIIDSQLEELTQSFLNLDFLGREKLLNQLK